MKLYFIGHEWRFYLSEIGDIFWQIIWAVDKLPKPRPRANRINKTIRCGRVSSKYVILCIGYSIFNVFINVFTFIAELCY